MSPAGRPDPYKIDPATGEPARASGSAGPIDPRFDVIERRGIHVITLLQSKVLDSHQIEQIGGELKKWIGRHHNPKVILDLHGVDHLSSAALGMFVTLKTTVEGHGGKFCLAAVKDPIRQVFKITKLDKVLNLKKNVDEAAASM